MKLTGLSIVLTATLAGCGTDISHSIGDQLDATKKVDLQAAAPQSWDRVCVIGPYQSNESARQTLGFDWAVESRSTITKNDGISLLLFVRGQRVVADVEHRRDRGDFARLNGRCFTRLKAKFVRSSQAPDNWPELVPGGGA